MKAKKVARCREMVSGRIKRTDQRSLQASSRNHPLQDELLEKKAVANISQPSSWSGSTNRSCLWVSYDLDRIKRPVSSVFNEQMTGNSEVMLSLLRLPL